MATVVCVGLHALILSLQGDCQTIASLVAAAVAPMGCRVDREDHLEAIQAIEEVGSERNRPVGGRRVTR